MFAGIDAGGEWSIQFPHHEGIRFLAVISGQCWLAVEGVPDAVRLNTGDCLLLPSGRPSRIASDMTLTPVDAHTIFSTKRDGIASCNGGGDFYAVGSLFALTGNHAGILLGLLPPIVHLRKESDQAALRWSLERMMQEQRERQPGSYLIAQQLAHMMLVQTLRPHLTEVAKGGVGWLFALADKQMSAAINSIHDDPGHGWTIQKLAECGGVAIHLCHEVQTDGWGVTDGIPDALANDAGGGQADEYRRSRLRHIPIAGLRIRKRFQPGLQKGHGLFATPI